MTIEEKIFSLIGNGAITIVNAAGATVPVLVFPQVARPNTIAPYVVFGIVSQPPMTTHDQPLYGLREWHFQAQGFSANYDQARSIANQMKSLMVGQSGDGLGHILLEPPGEAWYFENDTKLHGVTVFFQAMESF